MAHLKQQHKLEFREVELDKDDDDSKMSEDKKVTEKAKENETIKINKDVKTAEDVKINGPVKGEQNAEKNCNDCSDRPGSRQKNCTRHNKTSPADTTAES